MKITISTMMGEPTVKVESDNNETPQQITEAYLKTIEALQK